MIFSFCFNKRLWRDNDAYWTVLQLFKCSTHKWIVNRNFLQFTENHFLYLKVAVAKGLKNSEEFSSDFMDASQQLARALFISFHWMGELKINSVLFRRVLYKSVHTFNPIFHYPVEFTINIRFFSTNICLPFICSIGQSGQCVEHARAIWWSEGVIAACLEVSTEYGGCSL